MWRSWRRLLPAARTQLVPRARYQNYVMSDALAQLEGESEQYCPTPRFPQQKVTILGAGSDVGRIAALFLKQQSVIKVLALYDDEPIRGVLGIATDIAHIDTSTEVAAYQGRKYLRRALHDADVVLICGGCYVLPPCCNTPEKDLFFANKSFVRSMTLACARFCPCAVIAIQTPPVDANYALCVHTLEGAGVYNPRRVIGVNAINAMRANQMYCSFTGANPAGSSTPVICGTGRCTRVPVFSSARAGCFPQGRGQSSDGDFGIKALPGNQADCMTRLVREADDIICRVKCNYEQGHLSIGFATARCVVNIMRGLFVTPTVLDSALVEQGNPEKCYKMPICATPVTISRHGIKEYAVPTLNEAERRLLEKSRCDLEDMLRLGRCYAVGDEYFIHECKICIPPPPPPCPVEKACEPIKKE